MNLVDTAIPHYMRLGYPAYLTPDQTFCPVHDTDHADARDVQIHLNIEHGFAGTSTTMYYQHSCLEGTMWCVSTYPLSTEACPGGCNRRTF